MDTRTYSGLTLGTRHQPDKLSELQRKDIHDQQRFLTKDMRDLGMKEPPAWYVPRDEIDYYIQTGNLPKALAANAANADLKGICVPVRQDDGIYLDAQGDVMTHDDMADYFARLRAAPAIPPPPAAEPNEQRPAIIAANPLLLVYNLQVKEREEKFK